MFIRLATDFALLSFQIPTLFLIALCYLNFEQNLCILGILNTFVCFYFHLWTVDLVFFHQNSKVTKLLQTSALKSCFISWPNLVNKTFAGLLMKNFQPLFNIKQNKTIFAELGSGLVLLIGISWPIICVF